MHGGIGNMVSYFGLHQFGLQLVYVILSLKHIGFDRSALYPLLPQLFQRVPELPLQDLLSLAAAIGDL